MQCLVLMLAVFLTVLQIWSSHAFSVVYNNAGEGRKLFGGYRITPKECWAGSKQGICMFTHECNNRKGELLGACMDGFLVGSCCKVDHYVPPEDLVLHQIVHTRPPAPAQISQLVTNPVYHVDHPLPDTVVYHKNGSQVEDFTSPEEIFRPVTQAPGELTTFSHVSNDKMTSLVNGEMTGRPGYLVTRPYSPMETRTTTDRPYYSYSTNSVSDKNDLLKPFEQGYTTKYPWWTTTERSDTGGAATLASVKTTVSDASSWYSTRWPTNRPRPTVAFRPRPTGSTSTRLKPRPTTPSYTSAMTPDDNMVLVQTLNSERPMAGQTSLTPNVDSINDILNMLDENNPVELASGEVVPQGGDSKNPAWTTLAGRPSTPGAFFKPTVSVDVAGPSFDVNPEGKPQKPEPAPTVIVLGPFASETSSRPTSTRKPVTILTSSTGIKVKPESERPPYPRPPPSRPVPGQASTSTILRPPPTGVVVQRPPFTEGVVTATRPSINIEDFVVTQRPVTQSATIVTKRPTRPVQVTLVTKRPTTSHSHYTSRPTAGGGFYTSPVAVSIVTKRPTTSSPQYEFQTSVADLSNFPPVRNPSLNTSGVPTPYPFDRPANDVIVTPLPALQLDVEDDFDQNTVTLVEDDKLHDKMEVFVNKIVQSLQGNFQDLENVLYSKNQTEYEPTSRRPIQADEVSEAPSTTTKRPFSRPPTRKPTTPQKPETQTSRPKPTRTTTPKSSLTSTVITTKPKPPTKPKPVASDAPEGVVTSKPKPPTRPKPVTAATPAGVTPKPKPPSRPRPTPAPGSTGRPKPPRPSTVADATTSVTPKPKPPKPRPTSSPTGATSKPVKTSSTTPKPSNTTKRPKPKPTRKPTTTEATSALLQEDDEVVVTTKPAKKTTTTPATSVVTEDDDQTTTVSTKRPDYRKQCGVRPLMHRAKNGRIVGGKGATFGEWPWQVLVRESTWLGLFTKNKCGGVLITNKFVITAAHCQPGFLANLVAVFGEYDISGDLESMRSITKNVRRVIVHRHYDAATFANDLALLELESPVTFEQHIVPICMPQDNEDFTGRMATVSGWGRLKYGGGVPSVLQEVQVPVIENAVCQEMFNTAGHSKTILESFLCAGYANGQKDSCEGDSGGPLMIEKDDGRWILVGTVSHGIKCAAPYLPGVYMRTTFYKPWLKSITGVLG